MLLTHEQRRDFTRWLELEISSLEGIVSQMEKLPSMEPGVKKYRAEHAACQIVLRMITSGEEMHL